MPFVQNTRNVLGQKEAGLQRDDESKEMSKQRISGVIGAVLSDHAKALARRAANKASQWCLCVNTKTGRKTNAGKGRDVGGQVSRAGKVTAVRSKSGTVELHGT